MSLEVAAGTPRVGRLRALAHPIRLRILSLATGAAVSASDVARELGIAHASASYHVRQLVDAELLVLAEERVVRGGRERRYRYDAATDVSQPQDQPADVLHLEVLAAELLRRAGSIAPRPAGVRSLSVDAELWVDPGEWQAIVATVHDASQRLHEAARPPRTDGTVHVSASVAFFGMEP